MAQGLETSSQPAERTQLSPMPFPDVEKLSSNGSHG
jgi:hypothetical protein